MPFKIDHLDDVLVWSTDGNEVTCKHDSDYRPTISVAHAGDDIEQLERIRPHVAALPSVGSTQFERWRCGFRHPPERVLRVAVTDVGSVPKVAHTIAAWDTPGTYRLFGVVGSREFRYCLDEGLDPTPTRELSVLNIEATQVEHARDGGPHEITVDGEVLVGEPSDIATAVEQQVHEGNPDVLSVSGSDLLAGFYERAHEEDWEYQLGRVPGFQQLAGRSTYSSYGQTGH